MIVEMRRSLVRGGLGGSRRTLASSWAVALAVLAAFASCSGQDKPPASLYGNTSQDSGTPDATTTPPGGDDTQPDATSRVDDAGTQSEGSTDGADDAPGAIVEASLDAPADASGDGAIPCVNTADVAGVSMMMCANLCVNIDTDPNNCGGCDQTCNVGGATLCENGVCNCPAPELNCANTCVDITQDPNNCGSCGHNCQGGTCLGKACQATNIGELVGSEVALDSLGVDSDNIYWTERPNGAYPVGVGVYSSPISGPANPTLTPIGATNDPRGLALGPINVYWVDYDNGSINLVGKYGAPQSTFLATSGATAPPGSRAIALDSSNIYWANSISGEIYQMSLQGGTPSVIANGGSPWAVAIDNAYVYWLDYTQGTVNRVPIGGQPNQNVVLARSEDQPWGIAVALDSTGRATSVYWTDQDNPNGMVKTISAFPPDGGAPTVIASQQGAPWGIAVDSQYVYWTTYDDSNVVRAPLAGGASYPLASGQSNPTAITVDDKNVYWLNANNGTIYKVAK
jgi:hypothetical protein